MRVSRSSRDPTSCRPLSADDQIVYFAAQAVNTSAMLELIRQLNAARAAAGQSRLFALEAGSLV